MDVVELEKDNCGVGTGGVAIPEDTEAESLPSVFERLRLKILPKGDLLDFLSVVG